MLVMAIAFQIYAASWTTRTKLSSGANFAAWSPAMTLIGTSVINVDARFGGHSKQTIRYAQDRCSRRLSLEDHRIPGDTVDEIVHRTQSP
jgi:hypothetical protein